MTAFIDLPRPPEWTEQGLCGQTDPEIFFPPKGGVGLVRVATTICGRCEVAASCLAYALEHDDDHGIYGGTTPRQRRAMRKAAA